jgi:RNA exonuclease 1
MSTPPCQGNEYHVPREYPEGELEAVWQLHHTPTPAAVYPSPVRAAVALDCEMGTSHNNESYVIRLTLIDYFSAEILIDTLVWPEVGMLSLNTQFSGVTWNDLGAAARNGRCLQGTHSAREAIWHFVGE